MPSTDKLYLRFHGRIIDSLGIQMYQSPVAAVAELIANAWDADSTEVNVTLPPNISEGAEIIISDNGNGMTFEQCQDCYLKIGRNRRVDDNTSNTPNGRPILGRKGIGKFAGFGIANILVIKTTSKETGESTEFKLNLEDLRGSEYVETSAHEVPILSKLPPDAARKSQHGTTIRLCTLKLSRTINPTQHASSMARRFIINQLSDNFAVKINGTLLPENEDVTFEFDFPKDYRADEIPDNIEIVNGYAKETLSDGHIINWRFRFTEKPIENEELRGVSVFCGPKLAQTPFFFNLSGGLNGQHGQQYLTGTVRADYLDQLGKDIITTERQRINWEEREAKPLESWGQQRVKDLLSLWKQRRAEENLTYLNEKVSPFRTRLEKLPPSERKIVDGAIRKLAAIEVLRGEQFLSLANAILTAWEGGRLKELISDLSSIEDMDEGLLLKLLAESQVLNALNVAESIKAKLLIVTGLQQRISQRELENTIRDYIATHPWLLSPEWETFKRESRVDKLVLAAAKEAKLDEHKDWQKRVDLVLSSGQQLLVIEFMRPGVTVDRDHLDRFARYVDALTTGVETNTGFGFTNVSGLLVADKLNKSSTNMKSIERLKEDGMLCLDWDSLLARAKAQWAEFFDLLIERTPEDERLANLSELPDQIEEKEKVVA